MGASLLELSVNPGVCTNILRQVSFDYGIKLHEETDPVDIANNNYMAMAPQTSSPSSSEITLPPINSLMKTQSPNYNNLDFDNLILMAKTDHMANSSYQHDFMDGYQMSLHDQMTSSDSEKMNQSPSSSVKNIKFTEMQESEQQKYACELCARKYVSSSRVTKRWSNSSHKYLSDHKIQLGKAYAIARSIYVRRLHEGETVDAYVDSKLIFKLISDVPESRWAQGARLLQTENISEEISVSLWHLLEGFE